jgi:hypothetical protein
MAKVNPVQVQKYLKGLDYPAKKEHLVRTAEEHDADDDVLSVLKTLPDKEYGTPADVSREIGKIE